MTEAARKPITNVVGFDDSPFRREQRGPIRIVGAVCARTRLDGIVSSFVTRDGANATTRIISLVKESPFAECVRAVLLQGIAVAGFNVVDIHQLSQELSVPVLVVARHAPRMNRIRRALLDHIAGGARKWRLIEQAGDPEPMGSIWIQRAGLSRPDAAALLEATTLSGSMPEPLRLAHIIAGGIATGWSHGRT